MAKKEPQPSVGTAILTGLSQAVAMEPLPPDNNYSETELVHPLYSLNQMIEMNTSEGFIGEIMLY